MKRFATMQPTFLGIGAPRCGTSWLYKNLGRHPDVWLPPVKELHYFDTLDAPRILSRHYRRELRRQLTNYQMALARRRPDALQDLAWDLRYLFGRRSDRWYVSLFRPAEGQIAGEITPAYMTLAQDTVAAIRDLNPDLKIVFLMRDPIERAWSALVNSLARKKQRSISTYAQGEIIRALDRRAMVLRGDYLRALDIWERVFGSSQVWVGFLDDVQVRPRDFLTRLFRFLNISDADGSVSSDSTRRINSAAGYAVPIPRSIEAYLAERYLPQLEVLEKRFPDPVTMWRRRATEISGRNEAIESASRAGSGPPP